MTVVHKNYLIAVPLAALTVLATGCPEPLMKCRSAQGPYAVKYIDADTSCVGVPGNITGLRTYNPGTDAPDFDSVGVALQVYTLGLAYDNGRDHLPEEEFNAEEDDVRTFGMFESPDPDENGLCYIDDLGTTSLKIDSPVIVEDDPETEVDETIDQPAIDVEYTWTNMQVLATPAAQGLQYSADVSFTDNIAGCTTDFKAIGLYPWPYVPCMTDADCGADKGISVDFDVVCDNDITTVGSGLCVLAADSIPAYAD